MVRIEFFVYGYILPNRSSVGVENFLYANRIFWFPRKENET